MSHAISLSFALVALASTTGCWTDQEAVTGAVWSDNDVGQAYIELYYEQKNIPMGNLGTRNYQHRVMLQGPDGSGREQLFPLQDGQNGSDFYYLHQEGYVLMDVMVGTMAYWKVIQLADGSMRQVHSHDYTTMGTCPVREVLPSPDGRTLALIEGELGVDVPTVPGTEGACAGGTLSIDFIDSSTLQVQASYEVEVTGAPERMWTRAGKLHVWDEAGQSWRIDPTGPVAAAIPACIWPRTSSSPMSSAGVLIEPGTINDPVVVVNRPVDNCW
ncbi:MAG: hypothetical protein JRJ84_22780 [Deltaproteobacteria bacterium]|nr:hypothetical protein [Deltaproteobacteria bacterium]